MIVRAIEVVIAGLGAAGALTTLYLLLLAVAALFYRSGTPTATPTQRLLVVVPAHNEADLIGRCVRSLRDQDYPSDLFEVVVVADNCTDETASIAVAASATVLARDQRAAPGKGQALRWALDQLLVSRPMVDAFVIVDADSVASPPLLAALAGRCDTGAEVVQAEYLALVDDGSRRSELRAAALLLFHRVRFSGRAVLGLPCHLVGNGMLFTRRVLEQHPWGAFSSTEDLEYSTDLRLAGILTTFTADGTVWGPMPTGGSAARTQRLRWEGGRFNVVRTRLPQLLRRGMVERRLDLLEGAVDLAIPPLGLLAAILLAGAVSVGTCILLLGTSSWVLAPWMVGLVSLVGFVLVGLRAGHAPASMYVSLLRAPEFVVVGLLTRLMLLGGLRATTWERTERPSEIGQTR